MSAIARVMSRGRTADLISISMRSRGGAQLDLLLDLAYLLVDPDPRRAGGFAPRKRILVSSGLADWEDDRVCCLLPGRYPSPHCGACRPGLDTSSEKRTGTCTAGLAGAHVKRHVLRGPGGTAGPPGHVLSRSPCPDRTTSRSKRADFPPLVTRPLRMSHSRGGRCSVSNVTTGNTISRWHLLRIRSDLNSETSFILRLATATYQVGEIRAGDLVASWHASLHAQGRCGNLTAGGERVELDLVLAAQPHQPCIEPQRADDPRAPSPSRGSRA